MDNVPDQQFLSDVPDRDAGKMVFSFISTGLQPLIGAERKIEIMPRRTVGASCGVRRLGGKPVKTGGDVDAAAKKRPEEALFAALRPHDYRLRTWSRAPTAKPARPNK